ncbi:MAG: DNRLRE domain-containing protein [Planctomycetes bacterium]|nr:DNRLRE domain-containing protein [Planctomycetota bacterium]
MSDPLVLRLERLEGRLVPAAAPFTVAVLPDTQFYSQTYPDTFKAQTRWVVANKAAENIAFVSQLGDIVNVGASASQWVNADAAMDILDGNLAASPDGIVPYSATIGNHDYRTMYTKPNGASLYEQYFSAARYRGRSWYLEESGRLGAYAQTFTAGGYRFLHLTFQFEPLDSDLAWAQQMVARYPGLPTIISTHSYLNPTTRARMATLNGDAGFPGDPSNTGEQVFQKLIRPNPQIILVMNGHFSGEHHQTSLNVLGQPVHEMVADYQSRSNGGDGWMNVLRFDTSAGRIDVRTINVLTGIEEIDANSTFSFTVDFAGRFGPQVPEAAGTSAFQQGRVSGGAIYAGGVDTQLRQEQPTTAFASATSLLVDAADAAQANASQVLLRFDGIVGTAAGQIPAGARVTSARLVVASTNPGAGGRLHRMLAAWSASATWNSLAGGVQADGREAAVASTAQAGTAFRAPLVPAASGFTIDVTADVQAWADGEANRGWAFVPWNAGTDGWAFASSEAAAIDDRPRLEVEWVRATAATATFQQGVAGYSGAADTLLSQQRPTGGFDASAIIWAGAVTGRQQVGLLRFDGLFGSGAGLIPAGAAIESARVVLTTPAAVPDAAGGGASLVRLRKPFSAAATWASAYGGNGVQLDGIEAEVGTDRVIGSVAPGVASFDVTTSVRAWAGGAPNYGWAIRGGSTDPWGFSSSEALAPGDRPRLVVVWRAASAAAAPRPVATSGSLAAAFAAFAMVDVGPVQTRSLTQRSSISRRTLTVA